MVTSPLDDGSLPSPILQLGAASSQRKEPADPILRVVALTIEQLFTAHTFSLPWFQRAFAWSDQHSGRLLTDILEAQHNRKGRYWLGHMFLATDEASPHASIVDGHQRTVTLTMICALLRDLGTEGEVQRRLQALIAADGSSDMRLKLQPGVRSFFRDWVQHPGSTQLDPKGESLDLSEGERNLLNNRDHLRLMLSDMTPDRPSRTALAGFLLSRCLLTVESLDDEDEAWSLLTTAEETGLDVHSSERAKITLVTTMPRAEQEEAGYLFEQAQTAVGPDGMTLLLSHIRALKVRRRSVKPVEREILERFNLKRSGISFMRDELVPRAETMAMITRRSLGSDPMRAETAKWLETLFWLNHQMWMPAALQWVSTNGADHPETPLFFQRLDRLSYILKIGGLDPTDQERRFFRLLHEISPGVPVTDMANLDIEPPVRAAALQNLRSRSFYAKRFHALVLRRVAWNLAPSRDPGPVDGKNVTVEHVLPCRPPRDRQWWNDFRSNDDIAESCDRMGNLAFLSSQENHLASTSDFVVKRLILAQAASRFVLAENVASFAAWTPETILNRTETMIRALFDPWQLSTDQ